MQNQIINHMTKSYISHVSKTNNQNFQHIISLLNFQQVNPNKRCYPKFLRYKYICYPKISTFYMKQAYFTLNIGKQRLTLISTIISKDYCVLNN